MKLKIRIGILAVVLAFSNVLVVQAQETEDNSLLKTESGLQVKTILEGTGEYPQDGDKVIVHYTGKLLNGTVFDSSVKRGTPFDFELGAGRVIKGWDEGFKHIKKGGKATLIIPPSIGYGSKDMGSIPPNSVLIFDVELLDIKKGLRIEPFKTDGLDTVALPSGLKYIAVKKGKGKRAEKGSNVTINYSLYIDGKLVDSSIKKGEPLKFPLGKGMLIPGLDEGVSAMREGDKYRMIIPPELGFGKKASGIPADAILTMDIELLEVKEEIKPKEYKVKGKRTYSTESGLQYIIVEEGKGVTPKVGQEVSVHYTGYLEDKTVFDSSVSRDQVFKFPLGQGRVIKGWDEGVALMKVGDKIRFIIPANLAYGDKEMGNIPANSTLIFDVELIDVK